MAIYGATNPFCPRLNDTGVGNSLLVSKSVNSRVLATNAVTTVKIRNFNITTAKLATSAVTTAKIKNNTITNAKLATGVIVSTGWVCLTGNIAVNAVTAAKILAGAVTTAKIANNAVTAGKVLAGAITNAKLGANAVTVSKINANAVTNAKILNAIIGLGNANTGSTAGKLNAIYKTLTFTATGTLMQVTHGLGRTPVAYLPLNPSKPGVVYRGSTNYLRATQVYVKCNATVACVLLIW